MSSEKQKIVASLRALAVSWNARAARAPMRCIGEALEDCAADLEEMADELEGERAKEGNQ